jgi:hypothetical protein
MADEAEKLYNMSLCKMAESRSVRRGGASLHKHLLITTVLTKARSAIFDTWYMGEGEVTYQREDGSSGNINLNASFQEAEFPLEDEDDDLLNEGSSSRCSNSSVMLGQSPSDMSHATTTTHHNDNSMCDSSLSPSLGDDDGLDSHPSDNNNMIDPRFFVEVESEIELPSDILNCVEKLGDISEHMSFSVAESSTSSSSASVSSVVSSLTSANHAGMMVSSSGNDVGASSGADNCANDGRTELTYLDLDSTHSLIKDFSDNENNNNDDQTENGNVFGQPLSCSTPNPSKRRRVWSLEEEEDSGNEEDSEEGTGVTMSSPHGPKESSAKPSRLGLSSMTNLAKRLRFSPESENNLSEGESDSGLENSAKSQQRLKILGSEFRTKKSHFEEDEQEESSEDDPFLGEALGQCPLDGDYKINEEQAHYSRDRRVPSASGSTSSGSSSDEDGEPDSDSMEVDQITNLVQFISFNKSHQHQPSSSKALGPSTSNNSSSSSTGLVRSMSSPDLCGLAAASRGSSGSSSLSSSSNSANNAKDLFSFVSSSSNSHISNHRVLTMTV